MGKIVYNACFGGFGLSDQAIRRYAEIKGITLYPETAYPSPKHIYQEKTLRDIGLNDDEIAEFRK